jgi:hypothetical protein
MIVFILIMIVMALITLPPLIKDKKWGEVAVFTGLWILATIYSLILILEIPIISPGDIIFALFE